MDKRFITFIIIIINSWTSSLLNFCNCGSVLYMNYHRHQSVHVCFGGLNRVIQLRAELEILDSLSLTVRATLLQLRVCVCVSVSMCMCMCVYV